MKDKTNQTIPLEAAKVEFLEQMVQAHGLSDIGKAVRCLIDYARENPDRQADILAAAQVQPALMAQTKRCAASTARSGQEASPKDRFMKIRRLSPNPQHFQWTGIQKMYPGASPGVRVEPRMRRQHLAVGVSPWKIWR